MKATLIESRKIWAEAPHNAFTDLIHWKGRFWCAFREGRGHVSTDGRIRVLTSADGAKWESAGLISLPGQDLRDAHLSVTPAGRLMLLGGAAARKEDGRQVPTASFVSLSADGKDFSTPRLVTEPGWWLWQASWHKGTAYGVAYGKAGEKYRARLLRSDDGLTWTTHVDDWLAGEAPNEVALRFDGDRCVALVRRESAPALLAAAESPFKEWTARELGNHTNSFGGPNLLKTPRGWIAAGRMHDGGSHTALCALDVEAGALTRLLKLPSGGDTSYPGLLWHDGLLWMSYYSSHEGRTSIYLARAKVQ
ncbi:MAG TPA: exo-alpha-sialidase [Phycisphaerae bacterium]|nr:exo-alpha-sialidase [Phycisphaerae bacterium]